ncbi:hypothetical protein DSCA_05080 [Desulfosarcina alkanivorans]|jgi:hypothetical protein|uniref:Uncharacterized protein n=1 Tax=Desulfosarcina alkanivorans TaxID=571177 RepID=A0A5K7YBP3_9BACT|nr:hypothetical protein [Desulfosarcina alkanivorans]BBO66578.1 hypothetical protein DSCA_05080 [Desulfosarcina alkanivorans]
MAKVFRPSNRESSILSRIESSKEHARRLAINMVREDPARFASPIAMKLVEEHLVETNNKNALEEQLVQCLETLSHADEFDVDYQIAPFRNLVQQPNVVSLYLTAFVIEKLINHKSVVDIFGSDADIYLCIHKQVAQILP